MNFLEACLEEIALEGLDGKLVAHFMCLNLR